MSNKLRDDNKKLREENDRLNDEIDELKKNLRATNHRDSSIPTYTPRKEYV